MQFVKKHWSNILFVILIVLLFIPQTGKPIRVFVGRLLAFSPSVEQESKREVLRDFNWQLVDLDGHKVNLQDYKGKKILINFWATWCPPCVAELPSMQALYSDYKNDVAFLFVTNDDDATIAKFLQKDIYTVPIFHPITEAPEAIRTYSLPTTYLINEKGEIVIEQTGAANWNSNKVRALLNK